MRIVAVVFMSVVLSSCGFFGGLQTSGGVKDSAPNVKLDQSKLKDAVPRVERKSKIGNHSPYKVFGKKYHVMGSAKGYKQRGTASWYGKKFHGRKTSSGEPYNMYAMTAAHTRLPLPTYVRVKNLENGRTVVVRVNDRGPFHGGRIIDLSYAAATKLDMLKKGTARVEVEAIDAKHWARNNKAAASRPAKPVTIQAGPTVSTRSVASSVPAGKRLYLQVAAYQNLDAAQATQNRLLNVLQRWPTSHNVVIHPTVESNPLYRVRVGPLASASELDALKHSAEFDTFGKMVKVFE